MMFIFLSVYLIQLIISYYILRKVYIKIPDILDGFLLVSCLIPFAGFIVTLMTGSLLDKSNLKVKILDFIFMVKKS